MKTLNTYITEKLKIRKNRIEDYLKFEALEKSTILILLKSKTNPNIEYSFDCKEWIEWDYNRINLDKGQIIYMRGDNPNGFSSSSYKYNCFIMRGKIEASGNIMSLLYKDDFEDNLEIPCNWCFYKLFNMCTSLTQAPELPATNLTDGCYWGMFLGCTSLKQAPELPATELKSECYAHMFEGCTSLTEAPKLPATNLTEWCYNHMFNGCTSLIQAPELPATKLANYCYNAMFLDCTSLKQKPKIAADININNSKCIDMFTNCPCENK